MKKLLHSLRNEEGMTGLETAIILIAFVSIAAVFGYAVLSAGLFSAERGKETIYYGLQRARSNIELCGSVIAISDNTTTKVSKMFFTVRNSIDGNPIDMTACDGTSSASNKCVISLATQDSFLENVKWSATTIGNNDNDNMLEKGEEVEVTINIDDLGTGLSLTSDLAGNSVLTIQVKPDLGSTLTIRRTVPSALSSVMDLDLGTSLSSH